jgi:dihydrodipicolinate synthase/N-acetylneuraminate lyase
MKTGSKAAEIKGLIVAVITPRKGEAVDTASLKKLLVFQVDNGVDGVFVLGTTGEFQHMPLSDKRLVIKTAVEAVGAEVPVLVGISAQTMEETEKMISICNQSAVDAVVLAPVFGEGEPESKIVLAEELSDRPIMLYNNPAIHGQKHLDLQLVKKCVGRPKIIGIKDSSGDPEYFADLLILKSEKFLVFQGREKFILDSMAKGADGFLSGTANVFPKEFSNMLLKRDPKLLEEILEKKKTMNLLAPDYISSLKAKWHQLGK